jgi:hypothetical protein
MKSKENEKKFKMKKPHTKPPRTPSTTKKNIIIPQRYLRLGKNMRKGDKGHEEFFELFVS